MDGTPDRCRNICGDETTKCFVTNARHLDCITDIVINRVWATREMISLGNGGSAGDIRGILNAATDEMDELIGWMQNLRSLPDRSPGEPSKENS